MRSGQWWRRSVTALGAAAVLMLGGCKGAGPDTATIARLSAGEYGQARVGLESRLPKDKTDRNYLLMRLKLGVVSLADGLPHSAEATFQDIYELLDTKGLNKDKALVAVALNEDLKTWKGEPFEQAMAWHYMALRAGEVADWDNMRAAADSSLFLLADFGKNEKGERMTTEEIGRKAAEAKGDDSDKYLTEGYATEPSNFTLGYLMKGVAAQAMGRDEEAQAQFDKALEYNAGLTDLVTKLKAGRYNTLLVVDYGQGPQKVGYGPDYALAKFEPWQGFGSDGRPLHVSVGDRSVDCAVTHDLNSMAADHMWNNLQDVRKFKSYLGTGMMVAGGALAASGNRDAAYVGLGLLIAGAIAKAGAHADTRYCDVLPQRVYVAAITIDQPGTTLSLQVGDDRFSRMVLPGLAPPPAPEQYQVRYVRLNNSNTPPAWAISGQVVYANDRWSAPVPGDDLPYIMGGRCVRAPSEAVMSGYQRAGNLTGLSVVDLENLYRAEGITWRVEDEGGQPRLHVLEGGTSLVAPLAGTAGYARLFCQEHAAYRPRTRELAQALEAEAASRGGK